MRTPVGSSNNVARSFAHSSPGCEPMGVIFTFCAQAGEASARPSRPMTQLVFMWFSRGLMISLTSGWGTDHQAPKVRSVERDLTQTAAGGGYFTTRKVAYKPKEKLMKQAVMLFLASMLSCAAAGVYAAEAAADYPNKSVRFIAPFVPGGPSDTLSRLLAQKLTEAWSQQVIVDNRGSAGGIVGFELGAKAVPDGYTLLLANGAGLTINPHVYTKLPYDPARDFQPITQITSGAYFMVLNPSVPAKSVKEFIALAKSKPGALNFAATGTNNLLASEQFSHMAGIKMTPVNYKGTGQAITAVMSGEVQMFIISPLVAIPQIKAGKLRAIGVTGLKPNSALPDVPPIANTLKGFENITWHSVVVPVKTPKPIVAKLSKELMRIIKSPDITQRIEQQGLDAVGSTPEELAAIIKAETQMYGKLVKQIGLKPQDF